MSNIILKAENISKQYRLGLVGTGTLSHDLNRWWHKVRGKEDPYLKIGAVNDRSAKATDEYVWALQDINFEVQRGEVLGIIGKNGAGKSTLLKILSRVTSPTTGVIKTRGRIASLLEVGTGFHPELTGRENIFLNGAILGMTKSEIRSKIDEIVDFSGCQMYIDTPVKRYSSGMRVRLGFAVAAHLEPDILVVDEVLAVGDAEFQKKAIGKMQDVSRAEGRTILFVSHNMVSIKNLCTRVLCIQHGRIIADGKPNEMVDYYLNTHKLDVSKTYHNNNDFSELKIKSFEIISEIKTGNKFNFKAIIESKINTVIEFAVTFSTIEAQPVFQIYSGHMGRNFKCTPGEIEINGEVESFPLIQGSYLVNLWVGTSAVIYDFQKEIISIEVIEGKITDNGQVVTYNNYPVISKSNWNDN